MRLRSTTALAAALLITAPVASHAALTAYTQNFENLVQSDPSALTVDGWVVYGNVFSPDHSAYLYGYGTYPAPNTGAAFCAIDQGQGGPEQGAQQLSVFSDYENADHANGDQIESNVFHEQTIAPSDVGTNWAFQFDAKLGNLVSPSTALAFIKTIDPNNSYATTNFVTVDMTSLPTTWGTFTLTLPIDAGLTGQLLQFGFSNTATLYASSGVFYDNIVWETRAATDVSGAPGSDSIELGAAVPNPFANQTRIDYSLAQRGPAEIGVFDIGGRRVATLFRGQAEPGAHVVTWDGRTADGRLAPTGVYLCVLQTDAGRQARRLVLNR
jgi:hypothetical protein